MEINDENRAAVARFVRLWEIAEENGFTEATVSELLQEDLTDEEVHNLLGIVEQLTEMEF